MTIGRRGGLTISFGVLAGAAGCGGTLLSGQDLLMSATGQTATGGVDANGTFKCGGANATPAATGQGVTYETLEGSFSLSGTQPTAWTSRSTRRSQARSRA